jgi:hypothetical protein
VKLHRGNSADVQTDIFDQLAAAEFQNQNRIRLSGQLSQTLRGERIEANRPEQPDLHTLRTAKLHGCASNTAADSIGDNQNISVFRLKFLP